MERGHIEMALRGGRIMKRITINRAALIKGEPCYLVDGALMRGFECRGVVFVKAEGGKAWVEFHGDDDRFAEGGRVVESAEAIEQSLFNFFPAGELARLDDSLKFGAVNRGRVMQGRTAVTAYVRGGAVLCPALRFEGVVRSVTVVPPILAPAEPLNSWVETDGLAEFL